MKKTLAIILSVVLILGIVLPVTAAPVDLTWLYELLNQGNGTTYYVDSEMGDDSNAGTSEDKAWKTIDKVNSMVFDAGDHILFKKGCTFIGQLMPKGSGNKEDGAIVISSYGDSEAKPIIDANNTFENEGAVIWIYNQEYIEIDGLELTNGNTTAESGSKHGVLVMAQDYGVMNHIYVTNCDIHHVATKRHSEGNNTISSQVENVGGGGGIKYYAILGSKGIPSRFNDVLVDSNTIEQTGSGGSGIVFNSSSLTMAINEDTTSKMYNKKGNKYFFGSTNVLVSNNSLAYTSCALYANTLDGRVGNGVIFENNVSVHPDLMFSGAAMWLNNSYNVIWQNNECYDMDNGGGNDCGVFDADGYTYGMIFQYNYTHNIRGETVMYCNVHWEKHYDPVNAINNVFRYNISQDDNWGSNHGTLWVQKDAKGSWFYNNVLYRSEGFKGGPMILTDEQSWENHFYNNIFISHETASYKITSYDNRVDISNNVFYGNHDIDTKRFSNNTYLLDLEKYEMPLENPGTGLIGLDTLQGYMQKAGGEDILVDKGKVIENNGGRDFWGNVVSQTKAPDIGMHEVGSFVDTTAPSKATNVKATASNYDQIKVTWDAATDNACIDHYVVYINGEPVGRTEADVTEFTFTDLLEDTEYEFFVRTFDASSNTSDSDTASCKTKSAKRKQLALKVISASVHNSDNGGAIESAKSGSAVTPRFKVVNKDGKPVANALVSVQVAADSQNVYSYMSSYTDKDGVAHFYFTTPVLRGTETDLEIRVTDIYKEGYTFDIDDSTETVAKISLIGLDISRYSNVIPNSGFELVYEGMALPMYWGCATSGGLDAVRVAEGAGNDGSNALEITENETFSASVLQTVGGIANGTYTFTYYVKNTSDSSKITVGSRSVNIPVTASWQLVTIPDVTVSDGTVAITIDVSGDQDTMTYLDNFELSPNVIGNADFYNIHPDTKIPSSFYYTTKSGTLAVDSSNAKAMIESGSLDAVSVALSRKITSVRALRINDDKAFDIVIGQTIKEIPNGKYTFKVQAINPGGIEAYLVIKDYGGKERKQELRISTGEKATVITGIEITDEMAVIELHFKGTGNIDEYIHINSIGLTMREDYPTATKTTVFPGDNLMATRNWSFEDDGMATQGAPKGWYNKWYQGVSGLQASDERAHSGNCSLKVGLYHSEAENKLVQTTAVQPVPENATFLNLPTGYYTFSFWANADEKIRLKATSSGGEVYPTDKWDFKYGEWNYISLENIWVSNGTLSIGFYGEYHQTDPFKDYFLYIDDIEVYLQEEFLSNSGFESGVASSWQVTDTDGYSEVKDTVYSRNGNRAARIVLPATPSYASLASTRTIMNATTGTYQFSAYVNGTSDIEMYIKADGKEEVIQRFSASEEWKQIKFKAYVEDSVQEIGVRAVNPDNTTSSYLNVDDTSFTRLVTAADIANTVGDLKNIPNDQKSVKTPKVRDGFTITLVESSHEDIIDLDGNVTAPKKDTNVTLTFKISNDADPDDVAYVKSNVKVLGTEVEEEKPEEETPEEEPEEEKPDEGIVVTGSTAAQIAEAIKGIGTITASGSKIQVPVADGFTLTISKSSNEDIIDLDGNITAPDKDTEVTITFKIVNNSDPADVAYVDIVYKVLAKATTGETPEEEQPDEEPQEDIPTGTTAAQVAEMAKQIGILTASGSKITAPTVEGFTFYIYKSSNEDVIDLNGNITAPDKDTEVTITFKIVNNSDPTDIAYVDIVYKVLAKASAVDTPADQTPETDTPETQTPEADGDQSGDQNSGGTTPDNQNAGNANAESTNQLNWMLLALMILAILSVFGFNITVLLALKKKAQEQEAYS